MKLQNNVALKEWAAVLKALEEGKQTILLKKGGIAEEGGQFKPEHPEFFLYPTFEHQTPEDIKPDWRPRLAATAWPSGFSLGGLRGQRLPAASDTW